jgi:CPA1 family monovalent cation:H+ antiporter
VSVWQLWIYVINAYVFLTIGLQLRGLVQTPSHALALLPAALAISALLIVVRLAWVFPQAWIPRALFPALRARDPMPPARDLVLIGWTGMRGIVSLAAALALPLTVPGGEPFPARDAIVFVTFVVIFVTLVGQGLTLIPLVRALRLGRDGEAGREIEVRIAALEAGLGEIGAMTAAASSEEEREVLERLRDEYAHRIDHLRGHGAETPASEFDHRVQHRAVAAERRAIMRLRESGEIPDEIFRKVQYDLDLAESRLY